jgi:cytochrome d ubiquinol oxidase subunit II
VVVGTVAAGLSVQALARRRYLVARWASMVAAGAVVWGWFIAQSPRLLGSRLTIHTAAASPAVLSALAIAGAVVLLAVLPAFYLLYALFRRPSLEVTQ